MAFYNTGFSPFPDAGAGFGGIYNTGYAPYPGLQAVQQWPSQPTIFAPQSIFSASVSVAEPENENIFAPSGTIEDQIKALEEKKTLV